MLYRRLFLFLICYRLTLCCLSAEDAFAISGKVVNESTGAAIGRALVKLKRLYSIKSPRQAVGVSENQTFTDAGGTFAFRSLPEGQYYFETSKPGFQPGPGSTNLALTASRDDVLLKLKPYNSVEGLVTDGGGRPLQGVQIKALSLSYQDGRRKIRSERSVATDDRGYYRLWNLRDGPLFLKAAGRSGGNNLYLTDRAPSYAAYESFVPIYYGGGRNIDEATPLTFAGGQEQKADFRLSLQPAFRIRGTVSNLQTYQPAKIELLSSNEDIAANRSSLSAVNGQFEVYDVAPGSYRLRITQGDNEAKVSAETQVEVSSRDVIGLQLQAQRGLNIKIVLNLQAPPASVPGDLPNRERRSPGSDFGCTLELQGESDSDARYPMREGPDAELAFFPAVLPGEYRLHSACYTGYISAMTFGQSDLLGVLKLRVEAGVPPPPLSIHFQVGGGQIQLDGDLRDSTLSLGMQGRSSEQILLVPAFPSASPARLLFESGAKLAPGDYSLYLLSNNQVSFSDPNFIRSLRNGLSVRVIEGQVTRVAIQDLRK